MYNKHREVAEEAYKILCEECVNMTLSPELINKLASVRSDINTRYKNEYYVEFVPISDPVTHFVVDVRVHTVH